MALYYQNKLDVLRRIFGARDIGLEPGALRVGERHFPIVDDVIILLDPDAYPESVRRRLPSAAGAPAARGDFARDIQWTFGEEWTRYGEILSEHRAEFEQYFDLVDPRSLEGQVLCDLGCGSGRWSRFLKNRGKALVLVDFSEAVFVARRNLADAPETLFFMGDIQRLPFADDFCDFLFCLGVLHHLPTPCLEEVRALRRLAPRLLIFLYYALDNRPAHFRLILALVTGLRRLLCRVRSSEARRRIAAAGARFIYRPLVLLGKALHPLGLSRHVPLYDFYKDKSVARIEQDVYDRFFTRIEQRVSRRQIMELRNAFSEIRISENLPYWHFLLKR